MEEKNKITFSKTSRCGSIFDLEIDNNINKIIKDYFIETLKKLSLNIIINNNEISGIRDAIKIFVNKYTPDDIITEINKISIDKYSIKYDEKEIIKLSDTYKKTNVGINKIKQVFEKKNENEKTNVKNTNVKNTNVEENDNLLHFLYFLQYHIMNLMIEKKKITSIENSIFSPIPYTIENGKIKINKHYINLVFYLFYIYDIDDIDDIDDKEKIKSIKVELANNREYSSDVKTTHNEVLLYRKFLKQSNNKIKKVLDNFKNNLEEKKLDNIKIINPGLKEDDSLLQKYNSIYICSNNKSTFLEPIVFDLYRFTIIIKVDKYDEFMEKVKELCNIILSDEFILFTFKNKMNYPNLYIGINVCFIHKNKIDLSTDPLIFEIQFHYEITYIAKSINHEFYKKSKYFTDKKEKNINDLKQLLINYYFIKKNNSIVLSDRTVCMTEKECDSIVEGSGLGINTFKEINEQFEEYLITHQNQEIINLIQRIQIENIHQDSDFKTLKNSIIELITTFRSSVNIKKGGFKKNRNKKNYNNSKKKNKRNRKKIKKSKNTKKYKRNNRKKYL